MAQRLSIWLRSLPRHGVATWAARQLLRVTSAPRPAVHSSVAGISFDVDLRMVGMRRGCSLGTFEIVGMVDHPPAAQMGVGKIDAAPLRTHPQGGRAR